MSLGMSDSTVKVYWLNQEKIKEMCGLSADTNYLSTDGLKVHLYTEILQKKNEQGNLFKQR